MNDNIIRYYSGESKAGEMLFAAKLRSTIVCAEYASEPLSLHGVAQLLAKQVVKAHILEAIPEGEAPQELYQAVVHVAETTIIPAKVKWNPMRGKHDGVSDFAESVARRHVK